MERDVYVIDAKKLKKFFEIASIATNEIKLICETFDGVFAFTAVDAYNVLMCRSSINGDHFEQTCKESASVEIDVKSAMKMIDVFKSRYAQPIAVKFDDKNCIVGGWKYNSPDLSSQIELTQPLADLGPKWKQPQIPEINWQTSFKIPAIILKDILKTANAIGLSTMSIHATETHLMFHDKSHLKYSLDRNALYDESKERGEVKSLYSLDYLTDMVKVIPKDCLVRMQFGENYPLRLDFEPFGKGFEATLILAPRIERE